MLGDSEKAHLPRSAVRGRGGTVLGRSSEAGRHDRGRRSGGLDRCGLSVVRVQVSFGDLATAYTRADENARARLPAQPLPPLDEVPEPDRQSEINTMMPFGYPVIGYTGCETSTVIYLP